MNKLVYMLEDDEDDRQLTLEIIDETKLDLHIKFFSSGEELIRNLETSRPALIIIDHNSSSHGGLNTLQSLKSKQQYNNIPVAILSDSGNEEVRNEAYRAGANTFIWKPRSLAETKMKIHTFFKYWFEVALV